jgi:hypothetical protein
MYLRYLLMVFLILTISSGFANDKDKEELIKEIAELREKQKLMQDEMDSRIKALEDKLTAKEKTEVTSGFGKIKLDGLQQYRFDVDSQADDTFHMRRLELKFSGSINPSIDWTIMVDPSKTLRLNVSKSGGNVTDVSLDQPTRILQDAFVTWKVSPETRLEVGQQKIPFSLEGLQSSSALDTIDRALFMNVGKLGDIRDTGVQLKSKFNDVELTAAILNGVGENQNAKDNNQTKVFGGRFVLSEMRRNEKRISARAWRYLGCDFSKRIGDFCFYSFGCVGVLECVDFRNYRQRLISAHKNPHCFTIVSNISSRFFCFAKYSRNSFSLSRT